MRLFRMADFSTSTSAVDFLQAKDCQAGVRAVAEVQPELAFVHFRDPAFAVRFRPGASLREFSASSPSVVLASAALLPGQRLRWGGHSLRALLQSPRLAGGAVMPGHRPLPYAQKIAACEPRFVPGCPERRPCP